MKARKTCDTAFPTARLALATFCTTQRHVWGRRGKVFNSGQRERRTHWHAVLVECLVDVDGTVVRTRVAAMIVFERIVAFQPLHL